MGDEGERLLRTKENTRVRLIDAGRTLFYSRAYQAISVDAIAKEAGFTRAAFYLHFSGKDDLLAAMMIEESHRNDNFFRWFKRIPPSPASIEEFLRTMVRHVATSPGPRLFHLAALQNETARKAVQTNRLRLMAVLGESFPAFAPPRDAGEPEMRRAGEAMLAMMQIEQLTVRQDEIADPALIEQMILALRDHLVLLDGRYRRG